MPIGITVLMADGKVVHTCLCTLLARDGARARALHCFQASLQKNPIVRNFAAAFFMLEETLNVLVMRLNLSNDVRTCNM